MRETPYNTNHNTSRGAAQLRCHPGSLEEVEETEESFLRALAAALVAARQKGSPLFSTIEVTIVGIPRCPTPAAVLWCDGGSPSPQTTRGPPQDTLTRFQAALRAELKALGCPLPTPLEKAIVFPRYPRSRATRVDWKRGSTAAEWADAVRKPHGWVAEIPPGVWGLDLDEKGDEILQSLLPRLPGGFGLVETSPGRYHVWVEGEAPPAASIAYLDGYTFEVHGPGRLATLPPTLHHEKGNRYRWLRPFQGTRPVTPQKLGIVLEVKREPPKGCGHPPGPFPRPTTDIPLHELMARLAGEGVPQGGEWAYHCPFHPHDDHRSLMVNDAKGVFFCHATGCGAKGNRITLERLLGLRPLSGAKAGLSRNVSEGRDVAIQWSNISPPSPQAAEEALAEAGAVVAPVPQGLARDILGEEGARDMEDCGSLNLRGCPSCGERFATHFNCHQTLCARCRRLERERFWKAREDQIGEGPMRALVLRFPEVPYSEVVALMAQVQARLTQVKKKARMEVLRTWCWDFKGGMVQAILNLFGGPKLSHLLPWAKGETRSYDFLVFQGKEECLEWAVSLDPLAGWETPDDLFAFVALRKSRRLYQGIVQGERIAGGRGKDRLSLEEAKKAVACPKCGFADTILLRCRLSPQGVEEALKEPWLPSQRTKVKTGALSARDALGGQQ